MRIDKGGKFSSILDISVGLQSLSRSLTVSPSGDRSRKPGGSFRQARGYLPSRGTSPPFGRYQIILLDVISTWVWMWNARKNLQTIVEAATPWQRESKPRWECGWVKRWLQLRFDRRSTAYHTPQGQHKVTTSDVTHEWSIDLIGQLP